MPIPPFTLLLLDAAGHAALIADGPSGQILAELPLPPGCTPIDLAIPAGGGRAFLAVATAPDSGALCSISLGQPALETLPVVLPRPAKLAVSPDGRTLFIADPAGDLYSLSLATLTLAAWGRPPGSGACAGLAAGRQEICGAWEIAGGGVVAAYNPDGGIIRLCRLGGIPAGLTAAGGRLLVPFAASPFSGEGLAVLVPPAEAPAVFTIHCSRCAAAAPTSPVHAAATDGGTVYLACEDSAGVVVVDLTAGAVSGFIPLGRSVSRLALVSGDRFAVAASNANADLCLIDLVNRRPLAFTASEREFLTPLAVID